MFGADSLIFLPGYESLENCTDFLDFHCFSSIVSKSSENNENLSKTEPPAISPEILALFRW